MMINFLGEENSFALLGFFVVYKVRLILKAGQ